MSSFTEFTLKLDWCGCSLNNRITNSEEGNNSASCSAVNGLDDKIMNGVCP